MNRAVIPVFLLLGSSCAVGCSRPEHVLTRPAQLRSDYRYYAHIFIGRFETIQVVKVDETDWPGETRKRATFAVIDSIKGSPSSLQYLDTGLGGGDCAPRITEKEPYIIMADAKGVVFKARAISYPPIDDEDRSDLRTLKRMASTDPNRRAHSTPKKSTTDAKH